jgi:hypothetical protein
VWPGFVRAAGMVPVAAERRCSRPLGARRVSGVVPAVRFAAGRQIRSGDAERTAVPGRRRATRRSSRAVAPGYRARVRGGFATAPAPCGKCPIRKGIAKSGHGEPVGTSMDIFSRSVDGPGLAGGRPGMPIRARDREGKDSSATGPRSTRWPVGDGAETLIRGHRQAPDGVAAPEVSLRRPERTERPLRPACPAPPRWPGGPFAGSRAHTEERRCRLRPRIAVPPLSSAPFRTWIVPPVP